MKKITFLFISVLLLLTSICGAKAEDGVSVWVNGLKYEFSDLSPVIIDDRTMIPAKSYTDADILTVNIDGSPYIPVRVAAENKGASVYWEPNCREVHIITKSVFENVPEKLIPHTFRYAENEVYDCENCFSINGNYFFNPISIQPFNALRYAHIINKIAEAVPDAKVYNMLVPDSYEFYAPGRFYTGQWQAIEYVYANLSATVTPIRATEKLLEHANEKIYFSTDHHWTHKGAYYAWESFCEEKGFEPPDISKFTRDDTDRFSGSYITRMEPDKKLESFVTSETMERYLPIYETDLTVYSDCEMTKKLGKPPIINTKNNTYSCFISGDHPLTVIKSSAGNGKKLAIIKESFGNALATWAVNNYEYVYVIDIRGFKGGMLKISEFYENTKFDDLIIESYPTTVESSDLRGYLSEMAQ